MNNISEVYLKVFFFIWKDLSFMYVKFIIPPATKLGGVYWIQPVCLSVRLSVCLSVRLSVR